MSKIQIILGTLAEAVDEAVERELDKALEAMRPKFDQAVKDAVVDKRAELEEIRREARELIIVMQSKLARIKVREDGPGGRIPDGDIDKILNCLDPQMPADDVDIAIARVAFLKLLNPRSH